jgi:4-hydroxybutyrate dehydrogenase
VLVPETLKGLPDFVFATSSIDALIHAAESYLSPKANPFTELYSLAAIEIIMNGYKKILESGNMDAKSREPYLKDFIIASNYAGIAFGNAGCAAVHALSYSIGGAFHVPHGEANYQFFTEVFKMYMTKEPKGKIAKANEIFANILGCDVADVYEELEKFLGQIMVKKPLREYGMTEAQIDEFTKSTVDNQQRLLGNNYVVLSDEEIRTIFANLY